MNNKLAFVTRRSPHGSGCAREALDAVLASSAYCEDISLFFISDGVFQLVKAQEPAKILQRDISPTFGMLELYDVEALYFCQDSLTERGIHSQQLILEGSVLSAQEIALKLMNFDQVIHF